MLARLKRDHGVSYFPRVIMHVSDTQLTGIPLNLGRCAYGILWFKDEVPMDPKQFLLLMIAPIHFHGLKKFESSKFLYLHTGKYFMYIRLQCINRIQSMILDFKLIAPVGHGLPCFFLIIQLPSDQSLWIPSSTIKTQTPKHGFLRECSIVHSI